MLVPLVLATLACAIVGPNGVTISIAKAGTPTAPAGETGQQPTGDTQDQPTADQDQTGDTGGGGGGGSGPTAAPTDAPTGTATLTPTGPPDAEIQAPQGNGANIRLGPDTRHPLITTLQNGTPVTTLGATSDRTWVLIQWGTDQGWVAASLLNFVGANINNLPVISPVPTPPVTDTPTPTNTPTPTLTPTASATLNFGLNPNYGTGTVTSTSGRTVSVTSGGSVDVSYLGTGFYGFATSAPDYRVNWSSGSNLRISFTASGGGDTVLIVNDAVGNWHFDDDTNGLNPQIDFVAGIQGQYDIWVGSYTLGDYISGSLTITTSFIP